MNFNVYETNIIMSIYDKLRRQKELEKKYKNKSKQDIIVDMVKSEYQIRTDLVQAHHDMQHEYEHKLTALEEKNNNLDEQFEEEKGDKSYYKEMKFLDYLLDKYPQILFGVSILILYILYTTFSYTEWQIDPNMKSNKAHISKRADFNNPLKYCESSFWGLKEDCYNAWFDDGRWYYWDYNNNVEVEIWWDL